jgi:acyl-CoA reductase-like NAD-dependent aldehyde dehydrogenase
MVTGKNLIAGEPAGGADGTFTAGGSLATFDEASTAMVDRAVDAAAGAFEAYRRLPAEARAAFLDAIAAAIDASNDLIAVAAGTYAQKIKVVNKVVHLHGGYVGETAASYAAGYQGELQELRRDGEHFASQR